MSGQVRYSPVKKFFIDILMGIAFILLFSFALWLIWITYFREYFDTGIIEFREQTTLEMIVSGVSSKEHFHNIDETVLINTKSPSLCLKCHGNYPHSKAKEIRAFRNAHTFFMACEVCHLQREMRGKVVFKWLDNETGVVVEKLQGKAGIYGAKIIPLEIRNGREQRLDILGDEEFADEYLRLRDTFDADQEAVAKIRLHKDIAEKPVFCKACHTLDKETYLPFTDLGYTPARLNDLTGTEVVGMLKKYEEFHMPNFMRGSDQRE